MNPILRNHSRAAWLTLACVCFFHPAFGQENPKAAAPASAAENKRSAMADSQALCLVGDYANAETVLLSTTHSRPGTARGRVELASRLVRLALVMAAQGGTKAADELAQRALAHLAKVGDEADAGVRANAEEIAAVAYERLDGNARRARQCYEHALQLSPESKTAKEALERMNRTASLAAGNH